jgi:hypothetical protein
MTSVGSSVGEAALTFCFEVLTDIAFVPPLVVMHRFRRHFELYIGVFQLATGFLYNFCNALNMNVFLSELQWHALNNILTTTYFLLLLIHLQVPMPRVSPLPLVQPQLPKGLCVGELPRCPMCSTPMRHVARSPTHPCVTGA